MNQEHEKAKVVVEAIWEYMRLDYQDGKYINQQLIYCLRAYNPEFPSSLENFIGDENNSKLLSELFGKLADDLKANKKILDTEDAFSIEDNRDIEGLNNSLFIKNILNLDEYESLKFIFRTYYYTDSISDFFRKLSTDLGAENG